MILLISDVHCRFHLVNQQIEHAETTLGQKVSQVVVLGDFGLFDHSLYDFFIRKKERFIRPLAFIEGNHEEFDRFAELVEKYRDCFVYWPRSSVQQVNGLNLLCLGGAAYMDMQSTPRGCEIIDRDIDACLKHPPGSVDIIISHDCPNDIGVPNAPGFEHYGKPGFARGQELIAHFQPRCWVFGHHHKWFQAQAGQTLCQGLAESWNGYALIDDQGTCSFRPNVIVQPLGFWQSLWQRLWGIRDQT